MSHGSTTTAHNQVVGVVDDGQAETLATVFQALSTPSRIRILATLRTGAFTVGDLAAEIGMEQSSLSHQLRLLKQVGFVVAERSGKHVEYRLHDDHVGSLLDQGLAHMEHVRLGLATS